MTQAFLDSFNENINFPFFFKTRPLLYSQVQRGYALGDSQEYSKGFARMTDKTKIQDSNDEQKYYWLLLRPMFCSFIKCTSRSFEWTQESFEEEEKNDVRVLD